MPTQGVDGYVFTLHQTGAQQEGAGMEPFVSPEKGKGA